VATGIGQIYLSTDISGIGEAGSTAYNLYEWVNFLADLAQDLELAPGYNPRGITIRGFTPREVIQPSLLPLRKRGLGLFIFPAASTGAPPHASRAMFFSFLTTVICQTALGIQA
jgi:hypothetical protein